MKITLLYPKKSDEYVGYLPSPPYGLLCLAGVLLREGHSPNVVDLNFVGESEAIGRINGSDAVGIYASIDVYWEALRLAKVSKGCRKFVILGGPQVTAFPGMALDCPDVDVVVLGEGEATIIDLIGCLVEGGDLSVVDGIGFKRDGAKVFTRKRGFISDIDALPLPPFHLLPIQDYLAYWRKNYGYTAINIVTSRGCPYNCIYCSKQTFGGLYRARSPISVVDEMEHINGAYHPSVIVIQDDLFLLDRRRVIGISKELIARGLAVSWVCTARVDMVDGEVLGWMRKAGCVMINYGVESGSERMLEYLGKGTHRSQIVSAFKLTKDVGIKAGAFIMIGIPGETVEDIGETESLIREIRPDWMNVTFFTPIPGSRAWSELVGGEDFGGEFVVDFNFRTFSQRYNFSNMSESELNNARARIRRDHFLRSVLYRVINAIRRPSIMFSYLRKLMVFLSSGGGFRLNTFVKSNLTWFYKD
ncbi:MAG: radical SAM protein [Candidatus Altiarchaeota archaeon]